MNRMFGTLIFVHFAEQSITQNISQSNIPAMVVNDFQLTFSADGKGL